MSVNDELKYLLEKHLSHRMSGTEKARFLQLLQQESNQSLMADMIEEVLHEHRYNDLSGMDKQQLFEMVIQKAEMSSAGDEAQVIPLTSRSAGFRRWLPYAAALIIFLAAGGWFLIREYSGTGPHTPPHQATASLPAPSGNKVLLTLADGSQVALDDVKDGTIGGQKGVTIIKTGKGEIAYQNAGNAATTGTPGYNTITTPRGGQYFITLPDNTGVWLNAASSLKFPVAFTGSERSVELIGEGYFEVAQNTAKPFVVVVNDVKVNVLGTHFNIMAYNDENAIKTTLLEGSVKLTGKGSNVILKPGQQGSMARNDNDFSISVPNIEQVMAWKNGEFRFEDTKVETIMHQIARWYDLSVAYEGNTSDITLSGIISRKEKVTQLLEILEATHRVHFRIENNKVVVMPYNIKQ